MAGGIVYRRIGCLVTNAGIPVKSGRRPKEPDLGLIKDGCVVWDPRLGVRWSGPSRSLPREFRARSWKPVDCRGLTAYPAFVDSHTHPVFAGDRSHEFTLRMQGSTYQEIAAAGGGIQSTARATRAASLTTLTTLLRERAEQARRFGVRVMEAKSGYGLNAEAELRSLEAIKKVSSGRPPVRIVPTAMPAHAIPEEFKDNKAAYMELICKEILPAVARRKLARFTDIFCDNGYFDLGDLRMLAESARRLDLGLRVHAEELGYTGAAELAVELRASSVDHLLRISDKGIRALAGSGTVATLLPGTALYLREPSAPARKLVDAGAIVALATDFNPGTCPTQNLPFIGSLAAIELGLTHAEIIAGITWNAALGLGLEKEYGALLPGFKGEPVFCRGDHPSAAFYRFAQDALPDPAAEQL